MVADFLSLRLCADCDERDTEVLEFDHVGPKVDAVKSLMHQGAPPASIIKEMAACEVVCSNCHRRRTARRADWWQLNPDSLEKERGLLPGELRNLRYVRDVLLASACIDCGENDIVVLDFDHLGGKRSNVPALARRGCSFERLREEIGRCEVRCANCHRRKTLERIRRSSKAA